MAIGLRSHFLIGSKLIAISEVTTFHGSWALTSFSKLAMSSPHVTSLLPTVLPLFSVLKSSCD